MKNLSAAEPRPAPLARDRTRHLRIASTDALRRGDSGGKPLPALKGRGATPGGPGTVRLERHRAKAPGAGPPRLTGEVRCFG